jgi:hypothetical protein
MVDPVFRSAGVSIGNAISQRQRWRSRIRGRASTRRRADRVVARFRLFRRDCARRSGRQRHFRWGEVRLAELPFCRPVLIHHPSRRRARNAVRRTFAAPWRSSSSFPGTSRRSKAIPPKPRWSETSSKRTKASSTGHIGHALAMMRSTTAPSWRTCRKPPATATPAPPSCTTVAAMTRRRQRASSLRINHWMARLPRPLKPARNQLELTVTD